MADERFDGLARALAEGSARRGFLRRFGAGATASGALGTGYQQARAGRPI